MGIKKIETKSLKPNDLYINDVWNLNQKYGIYEINPFAEVEKSLCNRILQVIENA